MQIDRFASVSFIFRFFINQLWMSCSNPSFIPLLWPQSSYSFFPNSERLQYSILSLLSGRQLFDCIDKGVKTCHVLIRCSVCLQARKTGISGLLYWVEQSPDVLYSGAAKESTKLDGTVGDQHKRVVVLQAKLAALHSFPLLSHTFFSFWTGKERMISHVIIVKFLQQGPCLISKWLSTSKL